MLGSLRPIRRRFRHSGRVTKRRWSSHRWFRSPLQCHLAQHPPLPLFFRFKGDVVRTQHIIRGRHCYFWLHFRHHYFGFPRQLCFWVPIPHIIKDIYQWLVLEMVAVKVFSLVQGPLEHLLLLIKLHQPNLLSLINCLFLIGRAGVPLFCHSLRDVQPTGTHSTTKFFSC